MAIVFCVIFIFIYSQDGLTRIAFKMLFDEWNESGDWT